MHLTVTYVKTVNGFHIYRISYCAPGQRNWKGHCTRYDTITHSIAANLVQDEHYCTYSQYYVYSYNKYGQRTGKGSAQWRKSCTWGPARHINASHIYNREANRYQTLANNFKSLADRYQNYSDWNEQYANQFTRQAQESTQRAKQALEVARESADQLRALTTELQAVQEASKSIQQSLLARQAANGYTVHWKALDYAAEGNLTGELFGNGLIDRRITDSIGRVKGITTGIEGNLKRHTQYTFDDRNNVTQRQDMVRGRTQQYTYDVRDRLTSWQDTYTRSSGSNQSRDYRYDVHGNLIYKTNAGDMSYNSANQLSRRQQGSHTSNYVYDANGNQLSGDGRSITWNHFNKPTVIQFNGATIRFDYDADRNRVQKISHKADGSQHTTHYISKAYEHSELRQGDFLVQRMNHYLYANGQQVGVYRRETQRDLTKVGSASITQKRVDRTEYYHRDALGNVDMISDNQGSHGISTLYTIR